VSARGWIAAGAVSAALGVALGAFGAHGLRDRVGPAELEIWKTGVHYQLLHAVALVLLGLFLQRSERRASFAGWAFLLGSAIFAGTLYGLTLGAPRWLGAVTPIGGVLMIAGWLAFARAALRDR